MRSREFHYKVVGGPTTLKESVVVSTPTTAPRKKVRFDKTILEGNLFKESRSCPGKWNERYFRLGKGVLSYGHADHSTCWERALEDIVSLTPYKTKKQCFKLSFLDGSSISCSATDSLIVTLWFTELSKLIRVNQETGLKVNLGSMPDFFGDVMSALDCGEIPTPEQDTTEKAVDLDNEI